jgi:2'-5' RNA ligase
MHLCLSFLGDVGEEKIEDLKRKMDDIALTYKKFSATIGGIKFVPSENYIRVIVLEALDASGQLEKLRKDVEKNIGGDSKPPHLTLCRVKYIENKEKFVKEFGKVFCGESFTVDSIKLMQSMLSRNGPTYKILHESKLS